MGDISRPSIKITNERIYDFYSTNIAPGDQFAERITAAFEKANLLLIDLLESVHKNSSEVLVNNINAQIFEACKTTLQDMREFRADVRSEFKDVNSLIKTSTNEIVLKLFDLKRDYTEDLKTHLKTQLNEHQHFARSELTDLVAQATDHRITGALDAKLNEHISKLQGTTHETVQASATQLLVQLVDKMTILLHNNFSEHATRASNDLENLVNNFRTAVTDDIRQMPMMTSQSFIPELTQMARENMKKMENVEQISAFIREKLNVTTFSLLELFLTNFEPKFQMLLQTMQSPLVELIRSNSQQLNESVGALRENIHAQHTESAKVIASMDDFLGRYKNNSSLKGRFSENRVKQLFDQLEECEIVDTSKQISSGDFMMKRVGKSTILFENKEYDATLPTSEVEKFVTDCRTQQMHGILLSHSSNVALKRNYQTDIIDGKYVLVYVSNVGYSFEKIKIAMDIIDSLDQMISKLGADSGDSALVVSREMVEEVNQEILKFVSQRETIVNSAKEFHRQLLTSLGELKLPLLQGWVNQIIPPAPNPGAIVCSRCNVFVAKSKQSLGAHQKTCKMSDGKQ